MTAPKREEFAVPGLAPPVSHYCDAVRFGDLLFVSGMVGVDADGKVVGEGDAARQTRQIFENMKKVLDAAGARFADVLKVTVFMTNIDDRRRINPVRQEFFGAARPAAPWSRSAGWSAPICWSKSRRWWGCRRGASAARSAACARASRCRGRRR